VWDPHWGLFTALTVGVFVFLLRMPITGNMAGIAIEAWRIAAKEYGGTMSGRMVAGFNPKSASLWRGL
jgi:hypothetical protein